MSVLVEAIPRLVQKRQPYKASLFVNRQDELDEIHEKIRLIQTEQVVSEPVINFWGIEGIGKSWLLKHLNNKFSYSGDEVKEKFPTFTVLFDFRENSSDNYLVKFAIDSAGKILDQLSIVLQESIQRQLKATQKSGKLDELTEVIFELSKQFTPLILLDHADRVPSNLWDEIEKIFFEPIIVTGRVLVVVAGRRQIPRWRRFEVRRRVMESDKSQIKPFDKRGVSRQVENRNVSIPADLLYPYTAGNPQIVDSFVKYIQLWTKKSEKTNIDEKWIEKHNKGFLQILQLSEEELTKAVDQRLKQPLMAIAPLRFFRLEAMRKMLSSKNEKFNSEPEGYFLQLVRDLDQTEIVWWDREKRAYVASEVVRKLLNQNKLLKAPTNYVQSHEQAYKMYRQWAEDSPKTSDEFIIEMLFHQASICQATKDISCLRSRANDVLELAQANNLSIDRRLALLNQIKGDKELLDLFPDVEREELLRKVESLLNS